MEANWTTLRPTPPAPNTAIVSPMPRRASLLMTPMAVVTAQPSKAPTSGSRSAGTLVTRFSETIEYSLKVVTQPELMSPRGDLYLGVGAWRPAPLRQWQMTRSPGLTEVTPSPHSTTVAVASWPRRWGRNLSGPLAPSISLSCAPQMPLHRILTSTWPKRKGGV